MTLKIDDLKSSVNITELLDEKELAKISSRVTDGYDTDEKSRAEWSELVKKAMSIAKQTMDSKNTPFTNSSNIKYPLIPRAAIDFAARTYPEIIRNKMVVKSSVIGHDVDFEKARSAGNVAKYMNYQLLDESPDWDTGMDKLLHILPVVGTVFKKTYYDSFAKRTKSELCIPENIVVNYHTPSLAEARRVSHILTLYSNTVVEHIRAGIFSDAVEIETLLTSEGYEDGDDDKPLKIIEQHCYLDLDGDGYQEPYIVTVHKESGEVLRIVSRFEKIERNMKGEIKRILPLQYFTDYHFIPSHDGGFYSTGLGALLYPLNAAINSLINSLIDAGTLNNNQSGWLGRGLRLKNGEVKLKLGEWKVLDAAAGTALQQNVVPLPTKEPSKTLLELLSVLTEVGRELAGTNDTMAGKGQTQNVATGTVNTLVDQGMKVTNAVRKRIYRSLSAELLKIYKLNKKHLSNAEYQRVLDTEGADVKVDFDGTEKDFLPVADPSMASEEQRFMKAQAIMQLPGVDPRTAAINYLQSLQIEDSQIEALLPEETPPSPEAQKVGAETKKLQAESQKIEMELQLMSEGMSLDSARVEQAGKDTDVRVREGDARIGKMKEDATHNAAKEEAVLIKLIQQALQEQQKSAYTAEKDTVELSIKAVEAGAKVEQAKNSGKDKKDTK